MHNSIIAASLFQNKICTLPGIGTLTVHTQNASSDFVNTQILAPSYKINFAPAGDSDITFNEFSAISQLLKNEIERFGKIDLDGIGVLEKTAEDKIVFIPAQLSDELMPPVAAERVIRQNTEHTMLVGDKETTNVVMTEYFTDDVIVKDRWWIWAVAFAVIGIAAIALHIAQHGYTIGNNHVLGID